MTAAYSDQPKVGLSSMCRRDEHRVCESARARCACACHGARGQEPPSKEKAMPDQATVTALPTKPRAVRNPDSGMAASQQFVCPECGREFSRAQALGRHRNAHGVPGRTAKPAAAKAAKPKRLVEPMPAAGVSERVALAVIASAYADLCGADVSTSIESAGFILDALSAAGLKVCSA